MAASVVRKDSTLTMQKDPSLGEILSVPILKKNLIQYLLIP